MNPKFVLNSIPWRKLRRATLLGVVGLLAAAVESACSSNEPTRLSQDCSLNTDCTSPYICALGKCRSQCHAARDCGNGASCITDGEAAVCQPSAEKNTPCDRQSDCRAPLACATDYRCRNLCSSDSECNTLGITGRLCVTDANGVDFCADSSEAKGGMLVARPAPGHPSSPVEPPQVDGGPKGIGGRGNPGSGGSPTAIGSGGLASGTGPSSGGSLLTVAGGNSGTGGATGSIEAGVPKNNGGMDGGTVCEPACTHGTECLQGKCVPAGVPDGGSDGARGPHCVSPPSGVVSWWQAENSADDSTGMNAGTWQGTTGYTSGMVGKAFYFDGNSNVAAGSKGFPIGGSDRTIEFWARFDSLGMFPTPVEVFFQYGSVGVDGAAFAVFSRGNTKIEWSQWGQGVFGGTVTLHAWTHVAVVSASGSISIYQDGRRVGGDSITPYNTSPDSTTYLGGSGLQDPQGNVGHAVGALDEVTVYGRALTAQEVADIYGAGSAGKCTSQRH